jgi:type IV secretory pathway VirB10-like protein
VVFNENDHVYNPSELDSLVIYPKAVEQRLIIAPSPMLPESNNLIEHISASDILPDTAETARSTSPIATKEMFEDKYVVINKDNKETPSTSRGKKPHTPTPPPQPKATKAPRNQKEPTLAPLETPRTSSRLRKKPTKFNPSDNSTFHSFYASVYEGEVTYGNAFLTLINSTKKHRNNLPTPPNTYEEARRSPFSLQ